MIETQRLLLREYTMDDFDALYEIVSDAETMKHYPAPFDEAKTRRWIEWNLENYSKYGFGLWAVILKETGEFIGDCGITIQKIDGEMLPEIGYHIHKKYWRRGYAKEAAMAVRDWGFENTDYPSFYSYCKYTNEASYKTAEAIGMHFEKEYHDETNEITHVSVIHRKAAGKQYTRPEDPGWFIGLQDTEWPFEYTDHDRRIARAIVFDDEGFFYFVRAERDDDFGRATLIETSGGGVEDGEDLQTAIKRELKEELGVDADVICKIGTVSDYYNLIHRHNLNNYFLCKARSFGDKNLTRDEIEDFHLSTLKLVYEEAVSEYEKRKETRLGRLIANRELPILKRARELMEQKHIK